MGIITALASIFLVIAGAWNVLVGSHQARLAADMAAPAAAWALAYGEDACAEAGRVAGLNRAGVTSCIVDGADVQIEVSVKGRSAIARAGPL